MKLEALSHYDNDKDTRFGDCIMIYDNESLIVYDCGHLKHASYIKGFLKKNQYIKDIYIIISHNDSDHIDGIGFLLDYLSLARKYSVTVYTHQYLKYVDEILAKVNDGRRNRESLKKALLEEFNNIQKTIERAHSLGFTCDEALNGIRIVKNCFIVGPSIEEFIDVAAKAVDNRSDSKIGEGQAAETAMNAASIQLRCILDDNKTILLCADACPDYLKKLENYDYIQLPHHGQLSDAKAVFEKLGDKSYFKKFIISDNTGSAQNSGGSDDTVNYMSREKLNVAYNTKTGIVKLPDINGTNTHRAPGRRILGDLGYF